jgi:hypothetical protein
LSIGPGRAEDERQAHAGGPHHRAGRGLVAAGQQHHAVDRVRAQQLLDLHRQQVAVEHGRRLDHHLAQAQRRQLEGQAAGQQHAPLDRLGALAQMGVAGREVAPGIDDGDHGPRQQVLAPHPHLLHALAVRERAHAVGGKPATASQLVEAATHALTPRSRHGSADRAPARRGVHFRMMLALTCMGGY